MSRIEEALKMATRKRRQIQNGPSVSEAEQPSPIAESQRDSLISSKVVSSSSKPLDYKFINRQYTGGLERIRGERMLVSINDANSRAAEEFRKLKQNIIRLSKAEDFKNMLLVTSGTVDEGKSVTATNLAISLAQEFDHTVLLVDADIRRPSCHDLLRLENSYGLSDCLMDGADVSKAMVKTGIHKLTFLPAGTPMPNPGELLASSRMEAVLSEMKNRYSDRYIIIDSPPVLPFAESRILANIVDGVLLVVKEGGLTHFEVRETVAALSGSNLLGAAFVQATSMDPLSRSLEEIKYQYYYR